MSQLLDHKKRIHFVGIAGIGMSGLAKALEHWGYEVSGSDLKENGICRELKSRNITVYRNHDAQHVEGRDLVVFSSAIDRMNPELLRAREKRIPIVHRARLLAHVMKMGRGIGVLGTHGKTTTTALISYLLNGLGFHPTCFVGGRLINLQDNVILGENKLMVAEVDESDRSHLFFGPTYAVLTNIDEDHLDRYRDLSDICSSFARFLARLDPRSLIVYSKECKNLRKVVGSDSHRRVSYGFSDMADFYAGSIELSGFSSRYQLFYRKQFLGDISLAVPGAHNVLNSLAAISLLMSMGIGYRELAPWLASFRGVGRRLEVKHQARDFLVIDDYAHHPAKIQASLAAMKGVKDPLTVVFQPHRYSRTKSLADAFGHSFQLADRVIFTDIYGAGEKNTQQVDVSLIHRVALRAGHPDARIVHKTELIDHLLGSRIRSGILAFLGAGDITEVADEFVERFQGHVPVRAPGDTNRYVSRERKK